MDLNLYDMKMFGIINVLNVTISKPVLVCCGFLLQLIIITVFGGGIVFV